MPDGDYNEMLRLVSLSVAQERDRLAEHNSALRAVVEKLRAALAQRRLGPSLRDPGWMDREIDAMEESARCLR